MGRELFGHKKGAFTGADRNKKGLFQEAEGGTIFLDEIGDMTFHAQAKISRSIENKEFFHLGGRRSIRSGRVKAVLSISMNLVYFFSYFNP